MPLFHNLDNTYIENIGTGKAISILSRWIHTWSSLIIEALQTPIKLLISLTSAFVILYEIGTIYLLIFFLFFFLSHIVVWKLNIQAMKWRNLKRDVMIDYDRQIIRMIMTKFEILQNNKIQNEIDILNAHTQKGNNYNISMNSPLFLMYTIPNIILFLTTLAIFVWLQLNILAISSAISLFLVLSLLRENMQGSIVFFKNFMHSFWDVEKFWNLFEQGESIKNFYSWEEFVYRKWDIQIAWLNFSYTQNHDVLQNINLSFDGGKVTAIVWLSGSWKTTLMKLITGFLRPSGWKIYIDGQDIEKLSLKSYYTHIGYLTQEPSLFDGTIRENLLYGFQEGIISEDVIKSAIQNAHCEFIYDFPDWIETQIWEKGIHLSGGQRQRLAIAKIFIKNPDIIILDEPTSALDSFSEECIRQSFEMLFARKTVLIIAHRLQTVRSASDIIVLDRWILMERGNHETLIQMNGYYKKMLDLQSGF
jgi:ABC-type multidrug transport system fused ATPase/permease subunit